MSELTKRGTTFEGPAITMSCWICPGALSTFFNGVLAGFAGSFQKFGIYLVAGTPNEIDVGLDGVSGAGVLTLSESIPSGVWSMET